ncbi:MAG: hypothetical protein CM1200mP32_08120 [Methanobacteriota archaeon]|nr:MAG: hypothetical protein CM1200mP32_08120 [Euryarchaeota archaeon]
MARSTSSIARSSRRPRKGAVHGELMEEYQSKFGDPYAAARNGWLDESSSRPRHGEN